MDNQTQPQAPRYVGFWRRFLAYWVDAILLGIISGSIGVSLNASAFSHLSTPSTLSTVNPLASLAGLIIAIGYFVFFWIHENGQTLGHRLLAIRVVREDGKPIDVGTAIIRYIGYILSGVIFS